MYRCTVHVPGLSERAHVQVHVPGLSELARYQQRGDDKWERLHSRGNESAERSPANWQQLFAYAHLSGHLAGGDPDAKRLKAPPTPSTVGAAGPVARLLPGIGAPLEWVYQVFSRLSSYRLRVEFKQRD